MPELSIIEAAARLGVTENAVRKRIRRGSIEARKEGERWIVTVDDEVETDAIRPGRDQDSGDFKQLVDQMEREIEFLHGQIAAKDRVIDILLGRSSESTLELSSHLRHAIDGLVGARSRPIPGSEE